MIGTVFSVFLLLLVGYGIKKLRIVRAEDSAVLNDIVIYATLPAFIFMAIYNYKQKIPVSIAAATAVGLVMILIALAATYLIGKWIKLPRNMLAGFMLASVFGNTGFLGYPVVQAAFKDHTALVTAVMYDELAMALPLYILGMFIIAVFAGEKADHGPLVRVFKMPQLWAIPVALIARQFTVPHPIVSALQYLSNGTVPIVMISLGMMLSARSIKGSGLPLGIVCALKLAVLPAITYFVLRHVGVVGTVQQATVLEAAMPTAMMSGVLVSKFGSRGDFVAAVILVSTLLSILTIPLTLLLLGVPAH